MNKLLIAILCWLGLTSLACAQTSKTQAQLLQQNAQSIYQTQGGQLISIPLFSMLANVIASEQTILDPLPPGAAAENLISGQQSSSASTVTITATQGDEILTGGAVQTVTLPSLSARVGDITVTDATCNASTYNKVILPNGSDTIDGQWTATNGGVGLYASCTSLTLTPTPTTWAIK